MFSFACGDVSVRSHYKIDELSQGDQLEKESNRPNLQSVYFPNKSSVL
jgi:hypothetical protein